MDVLISSRRQSEVEGRHFESDLYSKVPPQNEYETKAINSMNLNNKLFSEIQDIMKKNYGLEGVQNRLAANIYLLYGERVGSKLPENLASTIASIATTLVKEETKPDIKELSKEGVIYRRSVLSRDLLRNSEENISIETKNSISYEATKEAKVVVQEIESIKTTYEPEKDTSKSIQISRGISR